MHKDSDSVMLFQVHRTSITDTVSFEAVVLLSLLLLAAFGIQLPLEDIIDFMVQ